MSQDAEISSDDGMLRFTVRQVRGGVQIVRRQRIQGKGSVTLVLRFTSEAELTRFCAQDELRFMYLTTIDELRRVVGVMLTSRQGPGK